MILLSFSSIRKSFPSGPVLTDASGAIKDGDRIALLGSNGAGKTTLMEILAGRIAYDAGTLESSGALKKGYLAQEISVDGEGKLFDYAMSGLKDLVAMRAKIRNIHKQLAESGDDSGVLAELGRIQEKFESEGGYEIESKTKEILGGLGFDEEDYNMDLKALSGGQRNRAALAKILISSPELLFLDEPTNHLDISGLEYLEDFIKSYKGAVVFVSHDRAFIRNTSTRIWEMRGGKNIIYNGNFDYYTVEREKRFIADLKEFDTQREFIKKTKDFISKNIAGQKTRQAQSRRRMLSKLKRIEKPVTEKTIPKLNFGSAGRSTRIVVKCENARFSYDDSEFLRNMEFEIERGDKIGLFGPNGSGKTTVLKLIMGRLKPAGGKIEIGGKIGIGYYDQLSEDLIPDSTPLETIRNVKPDWIESQVRGFLGRFLFSGDDVQRPLKSFSGGERSRLAIAKVMVTEPNFLVLDEPTNHLDIESREALENAIVEYNGTVLCVSHDRYFLDNFAEKIFVLDDGTLNIYLGDYSDYKEKIKEETKQPFVQVVKNAGGKQTRAKPRKVNPQIVKKTEDKIRSMEDEISRIEKEIESMEETSDWQKLSGLLNTCNEYYRQLELLYVELERLKES